MTERYYEADLPGEPIESGLVPVIGDEGRFSEEAKKEILTQLDDIDRVRTIAAAASRTMTAGAAELSS